jgi:hypothetical protein
MAEYQSMSMLCIYSELKGWDMVELKNIHFFFNRSMSSRYDLALTDGSDGMDECFGRLHSTVRIPRIALVAWATSAHGCY